MRDFNRKAVNMSGEKGSWRGRGYLLASGGAMLGAPVAALAGAYNAAGIAVVCGVALLALATASSRFSGLAFTVWVFAFAAVALFFPDTATRWGAFEYKTLIVPLIQVIMLGMGITLTWRDFARIIRMPRGVIVGVVLQFLVMPFGGYFCAWLFGLPGEVAVGLILIGSCAGGVASNVICYIAGGNVALSVTMTACSTLISPLMTPLAMKLLAGRYVSIETWPMMQAIIMMIVLPLVVGILINSFARGLTRRMERVLPLVSMLSVCIIIAVTIGLSRDELLMIGLALFGAAACHNAIGFTLGYCGARIVGLSESDARTVSIEVGMQNGGMATGLALNVLHSELAALASAVLGPWSAVAGSALASWWKRSIPQTETGDVEQTAEQPQEREASAIS
ncbi:MAG: bile acid:sodium symporter family protein [Pirellulaceae bacterium]